MNTHQVTQGAAPAVLREEQHVADGLQGERAPHHAVLAAEPGSAGMVGTATHPAGREALLEQAGPATGLRHHTEGQMHEASGEPVMSIEERERQLAAEQMRVRAREEKLAKQADAYVEKKQRDAHSHVQHEIAKADKNAEKAIAKASHKEATVHKKVEQKLAEAEQDRKKAEIDAAHKAAEKKAAAQQEAEEMIAAAREKAEAIKRGDEVPEKPSTIKKIFGMA